MKIFLKFLTMFMTIIFSWHSLAQEKKVNNEDYRQYAHRIGDVNYLDKLNFLEPLPAFCFGLIFPPALIIALPVMAIYGPKCLFQAAVRKPKSKDYFKMAKILDYVFDHPKRAKKGRGHFFKLYQDYGDCKFETPEVFKEFLKNMSMQGHFSSLPTEKELGEVVALGLAQKGIEEQWNVPASEVLKIYQLIFSTQDKKVGELDELGLDKILTAYPYYSKNGAYDTRHLKSAQQKERLINLLNIKEKIQDRLLKQVLDRTSACDFTEIEYFPNLSDLSKESSEISDECLTCLCPIESAYWQCKSCSLTTCDDCCKRGINLKIDERNFPLKCFGCNMTIKNTAQIIPSLTTSIAKQFQINFSNIKGLHLKFVPGGACPTNFCLNRFAENELKDNTYSCPFCDENTCLSCGRDHSGTSCEEYQHKDSEHIHLEKLTLEYISKNLIKCPKCGVRIEKDGGCSSMLCSHCGNKIR